MGDKVLYPLTHPQKTIWNTEKLYSGTSISVISATVRLTGNVDYNLLEQAINIFYAKNDGARLRIKVINNEPMQYVSEYAYKKLDYYDFSSSGIEALYLWDQEQTRIPFKIVENDFLYFALVKVSDNDGGFFIKMHHIISDAWTMFILTDSILKNYFMLLQGQTISVDNSPSYIDFILKQGDYEKSYRFQADGEFWSQKLQNWSGITALKERKVNMLCSKAKRRVFVLPQKLTSLMRSFCSEKGLSEYTLFIAALSMYICRVMNKEDLVIGTTLLNRTNMKEKQTVGMFVSTAIPLRISINDGMSLKDFTQYISKEILSVLRHQKYPYDLMLKQVKGQSKEPVSGLFDIVLSYQNTRFDKSEYPQKFNTRWHFNEYQIESLLININDTDNNGSLIIDYDYLIDLFHDTEIEFLHRHIVNLLWHALDNPQKKISELQMLSEAEKDKILYEFNNTEAEYDRNITVHQMFEKQVLKTPRKVALFYEGSQLTYRELNEKANQLARILRRNGLVREEIVGVMVEKSLEMIISTLAIMKAGGAYLPMDPEFPSERIEFMLKDCSAKILITQSHLKDKVDFSGTIICADKADYEAEDSFNLDNINEAADLIYIIYTSGSTGKPKGVMLEHRNIVRLMENSRFPFAFSETDVWTMFHSYCFDFSVWEMYGAILYGGKLVIIPKTVSRDTKSFLELLKAQGVTVLNQTPSAFYNLINEEICCDGRDLYLRYVIFGGEALKPLMLQAFNRKYPETKLINMYGITETTVHVTFKELEREDLLSGLSNIGRPIPTLKTYIMDRNLNLLPANVPGEICVAGDGVSRGYLNRPELTREKFVENPFIPGEKMYRSGDLARWFAKGEMEYLGRIDNQVKIRGFRIELGEIEKLIGNYPGITAAIVISKAVKNDSSCLCAYLVCNKEISIAEVRSHLRGHLPEYMIPSYFVKLENLPLNANGKIDVRNLPDPVESFTSETEYVSPRNEAEQEMADLWSRLLKIERVGIDDNFFELGGDSLTIIQMLTLMYNKNWPLTAADFYKHPTIRMLSEKTGGERPANSANIEMEFEKVQYQNEVACVSEAFEDFGNVLLTGATGYLGVHILKELITNTNAKVICLLRGANYKESVLRFLELLEFYFGKELNHYLDSRIFILNGDISSECFGLGMEEYSNLGKELTSVIHSAAIVKYLGQYSEFERVNVKGTERIINFCKENGLKMNYISTIGISGSYLVNNSKMELSLSENDFYVGQNFSDNVYIRSKFEAENLVLGAIEYGLNATIYRMGNLTGRHSDGCFQRNENDNAFYNIIKSLIQLEAVPEYLLGQEVEMTPVDLAARAVILISLTNESKSRVFHITNTNTLRLETILGMFRQLGLNIETYSNENFKRYIELVSEDELKRSYLNGIIMDMNNEKQLNYEMPVRVVSNVTEKYLKMLDFEWPAIDCNYIRKIITSLNGGILLENIGDVIHAE